MTFFQQQILPKAKIVAVCILSNTAFAWSSVENRIQLYCSVIRKLFLAALYLVLIKWIKNDIWTKQNPKINLLISERIKVKLR